MSKMLGYYPRESIELAIGKYDPSVNWIGAEGSSFFEETFWSRICSADINEEGYRHDGLYEIGGSLLNKIHADVLFLIGLLYRVCTAKVHIGKKIAGFVISLLYFLIVSTVGLTLFNFKKGT